MPGVLLIWIIVGQGPIALEVGAGGRVFGHFSLLCHFSLLSPPLWKTARYRLQFCLKGPLNPKQPTNQILLKYSHHLNTVVLGIGSNSATVIFYSYRPQPLCSMQRPPGLSSDYYDRLICCCCCIVFYVHGKHLRSCRDGQLT